MLMFQKQDGKYRSWAQALHARGVRTAAVRGSPLRAPIELLRLMISRQPLHGYVFRYLNDYPSLLKSLARFLAELSVIALVRARGARLFWIAHNVDRESAAHHPRISRMRRHLVSRAADVVFVVDPLLEDAAREHIGNVKRLSWLCFGRPDKSVLGEGTGRVRDAIENLRQDLRRRTPTGKVYVGLCVSAASTKCLHFLTVRAFIDACTSEHIAVGVVVVGALGQIRDPRFQSARDGLARDERVVLIDEAIPVQEDSLADRVDFFYRALDDVSVSYTVYVAAAVRKPLITEDGNFLAQMVRHYELGAVVTPAVRSTPDWLSQSLDSWKQEAADRFLECRTWDIAAERLQLALLREPGARSFR